MPTEPPSKLAVGVDSLQSEQPKHSSQGDPESTQGSAADTRTDAQKAADALYEENIEDEYAKREGGA